MPLLRLEHGELVVKSTFSKKGTEEDVRFTIETLELRISASVASGSR